MKKVLVSIILVIISISFLKAQNTAIRPIINNEKFHDLRISVYNGVDDYQGILIIKNLATNAEKLFLLNTGNSIKNLESIEDYIDFEDFNFDGYPELKIFDRELGGVLLYDFKTLEPMNLFTGVFEYESAKENNIKNFIYLDRGSYVIDKYNKTITIHGSCGAACGSDEIYGLDESKEDFSLKLVGRKEYDGIFLGE